MPAAEPCLAQCVYFCVRSFRSLVIVLQSGDTIQERLNIGAADLPHAREEAFLLVGGVPRSGLAEIEEARPEGASILFAERGALPLGSEFQQDAQKSLDSTVAIPQHPNRITEVAFLFSAYDNRHFYP